ncbi:Methionyl-tRNA formyltransferase [Arthrobotrys megalospora]
MSLPRLVFRPYLRSRPTLIRSFHTSRFHAGINILFCGSDDFSLRSLKALQTIKETTDNIDSIHVVVKYEKPRGRGLKDQRPNPIRDFAEQKSLTIFALDEAQLKDWEVPGTVDLIIAVSFGLFIPSRILESAKFGGLNVHPSFLPKYWGASPVQHAIINDDKTTGVVVQTLHPKKFDAGRIIAKSEPVDIEIDDKTFPARITDPASPYRQLESKLGDIGANLLIDIIMNQHYDTAVQQRLPEIETGEKRKRAPLLVTEGSRIRFGEMTAREVFLRSLVFDHLFCFRQKLRGEGSTKDLRPPDRTIMGPFRLPTQDECERYLKDVDPEMQWVHIPYITKQKGKHHQKPGSLALQVSPGEWACLQYLTIAGKNRRDAKSWADIVSHKAVKFISYEPTK